MNNEDVCKYFLQGKCHFGRSCRFSHPTISNGNLTNSNGCLTNNVERSVGAGECSTSANQYLTNFDDHSIDTNAQSSYAGFASSESNNSTQWAMTPEFIPSFQLFAESNYNNGASNVVINNSNEMNSVKQLKTYAEVVAENTENGEIVKNAGICPFGERCLYGESCIYLHGDLCDMCGRFILHPTDQAQRKQHIRECLQKHQRDMELSFKIAQSSEKTCGICFDTIMGKPRLERKFGILPNCSHAFCLNCIRKWRQSRQFEDKVVRSCPECRTKSDFVCPSDYWVDSKEDKDKLIASYKSALGKKHCKYFKKGEGECPFGNKCFYKHALPNGKLVDVGLPRKRRRIQNNTEENLMEIVDMYLWEYLEGSDYSLVSESESESEFSLNLFE